MQGIRDDEITRRENGQVAIIWLLFVTCDGEVSFAETSVGEVQYAHGVCKYKEKY